MKNWEAREKRNFSSFFSLSWEDHPFRLRQARKVNKNRTHSYAIPFSLLFWFSLLDATRDAIKEKLLASCAQLIVFMISWNFISFCTFFMLCGKLKCIDTVHRVEGSSNFELIDSTGSQGRVGKRQKLSEFTTFTSLWENFRKSKQSRENECNRGWLFWLCTRWHFTRKPHLVPRKIKSFLNIYSGFCPFRSVPEKFSIDTAIFFSLAAFSFSFSRSQFSSLSGAFKSFCFSSRQKSSNENV